MEVRMDIAYATCSTYHKPSKRRLLPCAVSLISILSQAAPDRAFADGLCPPGLPPGVTCGGKDIAPATAGPYALDPNHAAVIARVSHLGYSYSVFRFDRVRADLQWEPGTVAQSKLSVSVETSSVATNVPGFAQKIASNDFLESARFPQATFVSTAFRQTDATHGQVDGRFSLMGKSRPLTFDVELVGAGKGFGHPRLGIHATAKMNPQDFGLPPVMSEPVELVIDTEFEKAS